MILVEGRLQVRTYQDKTTGKNRNAYEVVANNVNFCGGKSESAPQSAAPAPVAEGFEIVDDSSDLPF
jgi:single-stranded DNA-binding protein